MRLQQLVAELGVADPACLQPGLHRFPVQHPVDREVLADVTQELEHRHRPGPVQVAHDQRAGLARVEVEEPGHLAADPLDPLGHDLTRVEHPLGRLAARVADQPGRPADQPDRAVPGELQAAQRHQLHQVPDVQPGRGRVEPAVDRDPAGLQRLAQLVDIGRDGEQAPPAEFVDDVVHACMVPPTGRQGVTSLRARHVRPVHRDGRLALEPEPPGHLGRAAHPDPRSGAYSAGSGVSPGTELRGCPAPAAHPERRTGGADVRAVQRPVDVERLAEPGRPAGQIT